jgi:RNA polymerase sigma-70 factor, ECF subfamily
MNTTITTEENYVKTLSKGDQKAFEVLFLYYQPKLVYYLSGFLKNDELSRDMAQDIFLSVWNNKAKLSEIKSFKAYIFKMGKNAICNYYDHSLVNERFVAEQLTRPIDLEDTEEIIFSKQLQSLIDLTVSKMPSQRKLIYTLSRIEGLSNDTIAMKLNINKHTVENHLTAGLADLRKAMKLS